MCTTMHVGAVTSPGRVSGSSAILDELVELAVGASEVSVALPIVLGWIVDLDPGRSEFGDRIVEALDSEPDRAVGVTDAARIGDSEMRSIRECEHVGLDTADLYTPEAEGVLHEPGHVGASGRRGSCEDQSEDAHERSLWRGRALAGPTTHEINHRGR